MSQKVPHCPFCGSLDVGLDGYARWDQKTARWVLEGTFDHGYCNDCEEIFGDSQLVFKEVSDDGD